jgi:hypothetical protein
MDIKVRDYLNIKSFYSPKTNIYKEIILIEKKIPYIWLNTSTLATRYIIETIDGDITKPIIGIKTLQKMRNIHGEFLEQYKIFTEKRRKKYLKNAVCCLNQQTKLPTELIRHILTWTNLLNHSYI